MMGSEVRNQPPFTGRIIASSSHSPRIRESVANAVAGNWLTVSGDAEAISSLDLRSGSKLELEMNHFFNSARELV